MAISLNASDVPYSAAHPVRTQTGTDGAVDDTATDPILQDPEAEGVDPLGDTPQVDAYEDPDAPPDQVAAYVKYNNLGSSPELGRIGYLEALRLHADDPEWLAGFYEQLGPEATASLISQTTDPYTHQQPGGGGGDLDLAQAQVETVRGSLDTLFESGHLDERSLQVLLQGFPDNDTIVHATTEIFAKAEPGLQELFFGAAAKSDNELWAAGALHVLNGMSSATQQTLLTALGGDLDGFVARAMAGEARTERNGGTYAFSDSVRHGAYVGMATDEQGYELQPLSYGGIDTLLETAHDVDVYYHARTVVPAFDAGLRADLFGAVSQALTDGEIFDAYREDAGFKEELSALFMQTSDTILHEQAPDGAFVDADFLTGMTRFFEITLFTRDPGENRDALMQHVLTTMSDVGAAAAAPPLPESEYAAAHGGWSQQDHVEVMGGLQGMILQAADNQRSYLESEILADREQRQAMIGFVTGMAFAFVPGASEALAGLKGSGSTWLQEVPGTIAEFGYDQATSQLEEASQEALLGLLSGAGDDEAALADVNAFMDTFRDTIVGTSAALPNGEQDELNLRTSFQSAYAFYRDLVSF